MKIDIKKICCRAKAASRRLAVIGTKTKNGALVAMASELVNRSSYILRENARDIEYARSKKLSAALIDRLIMNQARIKSMAVSLVEISKLEDPVGQTIETRRRPNGLLIRKVRVPIGVVLIIYESRPNVTSDCAGLCLKSGNSVILRGGSEALNSNIAIFKLLNKAASDYGIPDGAINMITVPDRPIMKALLERTGEIDLVMPRGGESLIKYVDTWSRVPVIKHYKGVCHTYVDIDADLKMAEDICYNAKVQRPGVCNAMETMLVHRGIAKKFLPSMIRRLKESGVEIRGTPEAKKIAPGIRLAKETDWSTEYLDLILSVRIVKNADEAIAHIMKYGSYHSDSVVTRDKKTAARFLREVDSACVYVNASTRFTDGGEFGKGAEIGISTDKIHARGPVGLEELTSYKYIIYGNGQVRK